MKRTFWGRQRYRLSLWLERVFGRRAASTTPPAADSVTAVGEDQSSEGSGSDTSDSTAQHQQASSAAARPTMALPPDAVFGIDFGTAFTSVAMAAQRRLTLLKDGTENSMFPSVVCYPKRGISVVGWQARTQSVMHPTTTFSSPKRLIGRRFDDRNVEPALNALSVPTRAGPNGLIVADVYGDTLAMPQVCAEVFRHARELGVQLGDRPIGQAVISVPVDYNPGERQAIRRAAEMAGLNVTAILEEPVAAAIGYGFDKQAGLVAVYDFGGGTFDCTLLEVRDGRFRILAKAGDAWLGGDDFDLALAEHASRAFWRQTKVQLQQRRVEWHRVLVACEEAKRRLSDVEQTELVVDNLVRNNSGPLHLRMPLNRSLLAQLCGPLVDRSIETLRTCLASAGVVPEQVNHVAMTGGVCRMPLVRERVQRCFDREIPLAVDPEHAVVAGNATYAHFMASRASVAANA